MDTRVWKFLSYYRPYRGLLIADLLCAFVVAATTLAIPLYTSDIARNVSGSSAPDALNRLLMVGAVMVALVAVNTLCSGFVDYKGHMMGALMERDLRADLFDHTLKLSFRFYDGQKTGQLMSRLTNDSFWMSELFHHGPEDIVISLLKFLGAFLILIRINVSLTLILFLFLPVMAVYAFYFNRRMEAALSASKQRVGDINAQAEDTLAGIRVVKSFTNEAAERQKFAVENNRFLDSRRDGYRSEAYFFNGMDAFTQVMTIAVIILGGAAILNSSLQLGDLLTYLLCVGIMIDPIKRAVNFARLYQEAATGFTRFMEIMEIEPDIQDTPDAVDLADVRGRITFRDVSFRYHEGYEDVIRHISLEIADGEYVALVGSSGVGKTTLCSLIPRFYEVTEGDIQIDGVDIRRVTQRSLRQQIGVVQQDVYLFAGTVADNIRYGRLDATRAEIIAAAKQANAHEFIMALPDGYETDIGQRGVRLSGGQKQRLSIARVFLKDPPILIFDEATSALDNESERAVQESMERLADQRTTLVIAHRLSTVRHARRIIVLTDSGIDEQGTHDELIARSGLYASLYNMPAALTPGPSPDR